MTEGIDVSNNNQGSFDNAAAFCWMKSTEGTSYTDTYYNYYVSLCKHLGIPWGAYHFAHPDAHTPEAEAAFFLQRDVGSRPMLDVESRGTIDPLAIMGPQDLANWIDGFLGIVPVQTIVYLNRYYLDHLAPYAGGWSICLATLNGTKPTTYAGHTISVVQHSIVNGIDRDTDLVGYFTSTPPIDQGDDDLQAIIKGDNDTKWYITNFGLDTRYINDLEEFGVIVYTAAANGIKIAYDKANNGPIVVPQKIVDALVVAAERSPVGSVHLVGTADLHTA